MELTEPYICPDGATCYIQSLVDRDPGEGALDFTCGTLTYDGHEGVDFRVATLDQLRAGAPVVAAAPGLVRATRNGVADTGAAGAPAGQECGNGVLLDHGDGWTTQYCHMANGSLKVAKGDKVGRGAALGLMGMSGRTVFPHLHFVVRRDGAVIDPFDGQPQTDGCVAAGDGGLWRTAPRLRFGGLVDYGFTGERPRLADVRDGLPEQGFGAADGVMIFWARAFGLRDGDAVRMALTGPDGVPLAQTERPITRTRAVEFAYIGKRRPKGGWPPGRYVAEVDMLRGGDVFDRALITHVVE